MAKRNVWYDAEVILLLQIMKEKRIMECLDGKRFKVAEIFSAVEEDMKKAGVVDKAADQIHIKWKKLKGEYVACKKKNSISGETRTECKFFDLLEELLEDRPVVQLLDSSSGFDSSFSSSQPSIQIEVAPDVVMEEVIETINAGSSSSDPSLSAPTARVVNGVKSRKKGGGGKLEDWKQGQKELQESFFEKQQELMKLQYEEEKAMQAELREKMQENLNASLANVAKTIMEGLSRIFQPNQQIHPGTSFQQTSVSPEFNQFQFPPTNHTRIHPYYNQTPSRPMEIPGGAVYRRYRSSPSPSMDMQQSSSSQSPASDFRSEEDST